MDTLHSESQDASFDLSDFLLEAELQHYYEGFRNFLKVMNISQLKYVTKSDLTQLGMSRPEQRRFKKCYAKYFRSGYLHKIKKIFKPTKVYCSMPSGVLFQNSNTEKYPLSENSLKVPGGHIIPVENICVNNELGVGEFGVVQQGIWTNDDQRIQVAIKCLGRERMQSSSMEFLKEAAVMHSIEHPNVVRLYGVVLHPDSLMLVTELAPLRSLLECLKEFSLRSSFPVITLCQFASQICDGMTYLENKRLIHSSPMIKPDGSHSAKLFICVLNESALFKDLAARNILVFSKNKVKISDFGLSRALGVGKDYYQTNYNVNLKLPIAWCAPECIMYLRFTSASDVWAYAVTLWEMFSYGFQPWAAFSGQQILAAIDEPNFQRLEQPECCPDSLYELMQECWSHEPQKRPKFADIATRLPDLYPDQFEATISSPKDLHQLEFYTGDLITVLKKNCSNGLWKGVLNNGKTGYFSPACAKAHQVNMFNLYKTKKAKEGKTKLKTRESRTQSASTSAAMASQQFFPSEDFYSPNTAVVNPYRRRQIEEMPLLNTGATTGEPSSPPAFSTQLHQQYDQSQEAASRNASQQLHEYSEIPDESRLKRKSLSENVMAEVDLMLRNLYTDFKNTTEPRRSNAKKFMTLTLGRKSTKPLVQPISQHDEKTLENAIAMTREITAKSMNELDHPHTPTSPNNEKGKNKFRFPSLGMHDKESAKGSHQRNFSEIVNQVPDLQSFLTEAARVAYASLIERKEKNNLEVNLEDYVSNYRVSPDSPIEELFKKMTIRKTNSPQPPSSLGERHTASQLSPEVTASPPPIPPRDPFKNLSAPKPRHARKHTLTIPLDFEYSQVEEPVPTPRLAQVNIDFNDARRMQEESDAYSKLLQQIRDFSFLGEKKKDDVMKVKQLENEDNEASLPSTSQTETTSSPGHCQRDPWCSNDNGDPIYENVLLPSPTRHKPLTPKK